MSSPEELRLLPWTTPDGNPCYLSTDTEDSRLSRLADDMEAAQLDSGEQVLAGARAVLTDTKAGERAVRFALTRATEALEDVIRIAVSRGGGRTTAWALSADHVAQEVIGQRKQW